LGEVTPLNYSQSQKMNKTYLKQHGITEQQYAAHQIYKEKLKVRQQQTDKFEDRFYYFLSYLVSIALVMFTIVKSGLFKSFSLIYANDGIWRLLLVVGIVLVISALLVFIIKLLTASYVTAIFRLFHSHKPFKQFYIESLSPINKESYFETIENLESDEEEEIEEVDVYDAKHNE
jgi:hypothetical protein